MMIALIGVIARRAPTAPTNSGRAAIKEHQAALGRDFDGF